MLRALKSYWAFTNIIYKCVVWVLIPAALIVINVCVYQYDVGSGIECFLALYAVDTLSDIFLMRGFYKKDNDALKFMQTSPRFRKTIGEIAAVDMIRRILLYQIPYITLWCCAWGNADHMESLKGIVTLPWFLTLSAELSVVVSRHFVLWHHVYVCTAIGYIIMTTVLSVLMFVGVISDVNITIGAFWVLTILTFIVSIGTLWYTDKKMKESYYD